MIICTGEVLMYESDDQESVICDGCKLNQGNDVELRPEMTVAHLSRHAKARHQFKLTTYGRMFV